MIVVGLLNTGRVALYKLVKSKCLFFVSQITEKKSLSLLLLTADKREDYINMLFFKLFHFLLNNNNKKKQLSDVSEEIHA